MLGLRARIVKELVEYIAKALVDNPDDVSVDAPEGESILYLQVHPDDRGKVIGRKGRTAHAIRTVLTAVSPSNDPCSLEIVD